MGALISSDMLCAAVARPAASLFARSAGARVSAAVPRFAVAKSPFATSSARFTSTKRYTTDHEWVQVDEGKAVGAMGVTEYAQKALGDVVYVELPALGSEVATGDQIGAVESVKAASDIFAPVAGKIVEVNESLGDKPGLINQSPETDGWLAKIQLTNPDEVEALLSAEAYQAHCEGEGQS